jgi:hypothetical protein
LLRDRGGAIDFTPEPDLYWKQAIALGAGWEQDR